MKLMAFNYLTLRKFYMFIFALTVTLTFVNIVHSQKGEEKIVYTSYQDGNAEIYLLEGSSQKPIRLTNNSAADESPSLSPDGKKVAFVSWRQGGSAIYVLSLETMKLNQLTPADNRVLYGHPDWSPDGKQIVYSFGGDIYKMDADGQNAARVTNTGTNHDPVWSPDGKRIAFVSEIDSRGDIHVMDADGNNITNLTNSTEPDFTPVWTSDGKRIAFVTYIYRSFNINVYVMDADGKNIKKLTNLPMHAGHASWSPDGTKIAFLVSDDERSDIYVMDADGKNVRSLGDTPEQELYLSWSPDGKKIAYTAAKNMIPNVYVMDTDGNNRRMLIAEPGIYLSAEWSPDGKKIAVVTLDLVGGKTNIFVADADGKNLRQLTKNNRKGNHFPAWAPDSKTIFFFSLERDDSKSLYAIDSDGQNERLIAIVKTDEGRISVSPDGTRIAILLFEERLGDQIHLIDLEGNDVANLGNERFLSQRNPQYSPNGQKIVFDEIEYEKGLQLCTIDSHDGSDTRQVGLVRQNTPLATGLTLSPDGLQALLSGHNIENTGIIYHLDMQSGEVTEWCEDCKSPDWIDPNFIFSINPAGKLLATWGMIKKEAR
jgi:TolB protein